jgi:hypothetical protein
MRTNPTKLGTATSILSKQFERLEPFDGAQGKLFERFKPLELLERLEPLERVFRIKA